MFEKNPDLFNVFLMDLSNEKIRVSQAKKEIPEIVVYVMFFVIF